MRPAARLSAAIDILDAWQSGSRVEQSLSAWARGARYAGSKDRAAVRDHVFDVLRRTGSCVAAGGGEDGRALVLGLARLQGLDVAALFAGDGHGPAALTETERAFVGPVVDPARDVPDWTLPLLEARVGDDLPALLAALGARAPVWLRVNLRRGTRDEAAAMLRDDGIVAVPDAACATALEVTEGARRVRLSRAFEAGMVELQDLSVQRAVARVDWPEAGHVLDYCAGGGGKSLAIADRTDARVTAHDATPRRMIDLPVRAARAGVKIDVRETQALQGGFDAVLCDVPCSGSGTWRRDPEAKWRLTPERLTALTGTQDEILDAGARLVAPGGRLVYMTCSLFPLENEARIGAFVERTGGWRCTGAHCDTPLTASDGFFTATLAKI